MIEKLPAHSPLGASSAKRWTSCPGSVKLAEKFPKTDSDFALEGTAAHALAETVLKNKPGPNAFWYIGREKEIKDFPAGFKVTEEMAGHVQAYVDYVRNYVNELKGELLVEHKFHLKHLHPAFYGTCDAIVMQPFGELHVFDFKYGAGILVEATENMQSQFYALGAIELGDFSKIVIHICQPRIDHDGGFRYWETSPEALFEFGKFLQARAAETEKPDAPLKPSAEACQFCPAKGGCPAIHKKAVELAKTDFKAPSFPAPSALPMETISKILEHKKLFMQWLDSVEEYATRKLLTGETYEGLKLVRGRSQRRWTDEALAEAYLCSKLGEAAYSKKLLSVAQAEKLVREDLPLDMLETVDGELVAAPESDRRKAVGLIDFQFKKEEF